MCLYKTRDLSRTGNYWETTVYQNQQQAKQFLKVSLNSNKKGHFKVLNSKKRVAFILKTFESDFKLY